jgi:hypothetical protein
MQNRRHMIKIGIWDLSKRKIYCVRVCSSRQALSNQHWIAKFGVDTVGNEPSEVSNKIESGEPISAVAGGIETE